ncbi:MAG: type II toxin-antitoxin system Phd/YefM family antitoxin [Candidatus Omnitrophica bacterium]|nr:type II toxin-antitoxin system Phd/YefM family antitoxin [Candidatus Omnitrophota bacterium]MCB9770505.1 type II toxin-antitoxin system Phd/YefM family antitoxin [Candidatus Omnitrophota bacterium]
MKKGGDGAVSKIWQMQEAKNKLSELVDLATSEGPQTITRHGKDAAILISPEEFRKLNGRKGTLLEFFQNSPLQGLDLERNRDFPREVDL